MITEIAVERVEFTCGACRYRWSVDYDVQRHRDALDAEWEYYHRDNVPVPSPYTPAGAPPCPHCGRRWAGRLVARRPVSLRGKADVSRGRVPTGGVHRSDRHTVPLLREAGHPQPESPGRADERA